MGTGVRGAARLHLARSDPQKIALVLEHAPQLPSHGGIVPPIAPPPANTSATSFRFERREVFPTDESAIMEQSEQDQQVGSQVCQFAIAPLILLPAGLDTSCIVSHMLLPASKMQRQRCLLLCIGLERLLNAGIYALSAGFKAINFAAQACLSPIKTSGVEKDRAADLTIRLVVLPE